MCGIAGFYDSKISSEKQEQIIDQMLEIMQHRGPDASGKYIDSPMVLGHNRLSIIDLSEGANQPMELENGTIILNGEIYNYVEIREELKKMGYLFHTQSDTEVVLNSYFAWGEKCVEHFVGMWAFAIWDKTKKTLFCSCDRFGIKPLYYIYHNKSLYFASELKALKKCPTFVNELNEMQIYRGLQLGWLFYQDETYYSKINRLQEASNLIFDGNTLIIYKYWDIDLTQKIDISFEDKHIRFREMFLDSIRLHMRSDVKVGACLSGGLDSSAIVSAVSNLFPDSTIDTFTIFYEGENQVDERPWVYEVVKQYKNLNPFYYSPKDSELPEAFEQAQYHCDVPLAGSSPISQYFLMRLASQNGVKVLLDGQGSDEYLAGYMHSFDRLIGGMFKSLQFSQALSTLVKHKSLHKPTSAQFGLQLMKSIIAAFTSEQKMYYYAFKHKNTNFAKNNKENPPFLIKGKPETDLLNEFLYNLTFVTSLPNLLHFEDRNSMAFSIESRVPFLDHRLVEYAFTLQNDDKIHQGETKYILRKSMEGILPDAIIKRQDKKGFVTPGEDIWLKGPLKHLMEMNFSNAGFIDVKKAKKAVEQYKHGAKNSQIVWRLAALNQWLNKQ